MKFKIFGNLLKDALAKALILGEDYEEYTGEIIEFAELEAVTDRILAEYIVTKLADDENVLSKLSGEGRTVGDSLKEAVLSDLEQIGRAIKSVYDYSYTPSFGEKRYCDSYTRSIKAMTCASSEELYPLLLKHYATLGTGIYARYTALLCSKNGVSGIEKPDTTDFSALVGLEHIKQILHDNTELFLSGERANNVLLFGDRGTGKSSCVKALLNKYADRGLRVIELPKNCITMIPDLYKELEKRPQKFILYLDDLSFEKHEPEYRSLKVSMEGQLGSIPQNVLIFATSNRRHLIKENWKDREGGDVHAGDNMQEMLSLSERFGISLVFSAPNQREYLDIVRTLLSRKGIEITDEIEKKAIAWQMNYGGRTPRCASQFVAAYKEE